MAYSFVVLCVTVIVAELITLLLNRQVSESVVLPIFVWVLLFSVVLGTAMAVFTSRRILGSVLRLSGAMRAVAAGDYSVRLEDESRVRIIRNTFADFNTMARALGATETLQSDFISGVSHEFKTPINAIEGYAMLLQERQQSEEECQECVDKILYNTRRLSGLVGNILLLSRVENQAIQSQKTAFRLDEQIRQAVLSLEPKWTEKQIDFDADLDPVSCVGNESLLMQVWLNLIDNAVKFDPYGGVVRLKLRQENDRARFEIEDNGPGISPEAQQHIFDKFYQSDTSHKMEGNGLGLALVKKILTACGGDITVHSAPDCGSRFVVGLPL